MILAAYAIVRYAAIRMTPDELKIARALAAQADAGDQAAGAALEKIVAQVVTDRKRRIPNGNKKL
jgi:hypothetical protein